mgnify:CR=1 FL=1
MITELEKVDFILKEGLKKGMSLSKFVNTQINEFKESNEYKLMQMGSQYYKNNGDIRDKERTYIDENGLEKVSPHAQNFKLHHPILYKMINQKAGYLLRKKPTVKQVIEKGEKEDPEYKKILGDIFNNKMHKRLKYTLIEAVKRGIAWWQIYIDESGDLKVRLRYATRIIPIWEDEEHEVLAAIIMVYEVEEYTSETQKEKKTKVEYWDLEGVRYYILDGSNLIEDVEEVEKRKDLFIKIDEEGNSILGHFSIDGVPQLWDKIPFVYWKYNGDELPLIYFLKTLVDAYDYLCSKTADAIYEAPDGVNVVKNYGDEVNTFQKNLQTFNTVFLETDGEYSRESVKIEIDAFKVFIEQLRKDIYESGFCVDTQSEKFGTQESGVAIKQLYADLDLDCSNIETEFKSSLEYFMYFVNSWAQGKTGKEYMENEVELVLNKTMTVNEKELIENCKNSVGVISNASIIAHHPWVSDPEDELEKIKQENEEEQKEYEESLNKQLKELKNKTNTNNNEGENNKKEESAEVGDK